MPDYLNWSEGWLRASVAALKPGGALFIYGSPCKLRICHLKLLAASLGLEFKQHIRCGSKGLCCCWLLLLWLLLLAAAGCC